MRILGTTAAGSPAPSALTIRTVTAASSILRARYLAGAAACTKSNTLLIVGDLA
jgi:hypothetical protein